MTWLSVVTAVTFIFGFVGMGTLSVLGASLRHQSAGTTRQTWNRRMLSAGIGATGAAILVPFLALAWVTALFFGIGWVALGILLAAMFAGRVPTRLLAALLFLTTALFAVVALPAHRGTFDAVGVFVVVGLLFAKCTRVLQRRGAKQGQTF